MRTVTSVQVGFGFVYEDKDDPKMWVDLTVNGQGILMSPQLTRKIARQLLDFADYVEGTPNDDPDGQEEVDEDDEEQCEIVTLVPRVA